MTEHEQGFISGNVDYACLCIEEAHCRPVGSNTILRLICWQYISRVAGKECYREGLHNVLQL
jgi:hypothetical protein